MVASVARLSLLTAIVLGLSLKPAGLAAQDPCENELDPPPECFSVSVSPDGTTLIRAPGSYSAVFTVTNTGQQPDNYSLACTGTGNVTACTAGVEFLQLQPGQAVDVTVSYSVGSGATGTLFLSATGAGNGIDSGYYTIEAATYTVAVTPDGGSQSAFSGSTNNAATFTIENLGNQGQLTYSLSIVGCTAPLVNCTAPASVAVTPGAPQPVTASFDAQSTTGTGTITLRATHAASGTSNDGWITVTVSASPTYTVVVTPDNGSQSVSGGSTGNSATFQVQNQGNQGQLVYNLSIVSCATPLLNCASPVSVSVPQGQTQSVAVTFDAQNTAGTGEIRLRATHAASGTSDDGWINATVPATYTVVVSPDGGSQSATGGSTNNPAAFTVRNDGNQGLLTYSLSIASCTAPLVSCTTPASVDLLQGETKSVTAQFNAQNTTGTGRITLKATHAGSGTADTGWINATVTATTGDCTDELNPPPDCFRVEVVPDGDVRARVANTAGHSDTFTVTNAGAQQDTYSIACTGGGSVTSCSAGASSLLLQPGQSAQVGVTYSVGSGTSGTLTLNATGTGLGVDGGHYTIQLSGVAVTPDAGAEPTRVPNTGPYAAVFTVRNTGSGADSYTLTCAASANVTCGTVGPATLSLLNGAEGAVTVSYTVGAAGGGSVSLIAIAPSGASDAGSFTVSVSQPAGAPIVDVTPYVYAKQDYGRCAYACFAAVHAQSTVPYFSLNTPRSVTLVYNSDRVIPRPFVHVNVTPEAGFSPTQWQLQVSVKGVFVTFLNGEQVLRFTPDTLRRTVRLGASSTRRWLWWTRRRSIRWTSSSRRSIRAGW